MAAKSKVLNKATLENGISKPNNRIDHILFENINRFRDVEIDQIYIFLHFFINI